MFVLNGYTHSLVNVEGRNVVFLILKKYYGSFYPNDVIVKFKYIVTLYLFKVYS